MSRSGGPGGQNADSRSTAVRARVTINNLPLSDIQKQFIREHVPPKNRAGDDVVVKIDEHRSQHQNKQAAFDKLVETINEAIRTGNEQAKEAQRQKQIKKQSRGGSGGGSEDIEETKKKQLRSESTDDLIEQAYEEDPETMKDYLEDPDDPD
jgi:protein subunit release factor B